MDKRKILEHIEIFKGLSAEELEPIANICEPREYRAKTVIFSENSKGKEMYIVTKGRVCIELGIKGKDDTVKVHNVPEGEIFGELSIISEGRRSGTAKCESDCEVLSIDGDTLLNLFNKQSRIGYVVMRNLASLVAARLRKTDLQLVACFLWE